MPATIVIPEEFTADPDLSALEKGGLDIVAFQDYMNIVKAFERGAHYSSTEAALFAPMSKTVQNIKELSGSSAEILSSWLVQPVKDNSPDAKAGVKFNDMFDSVREKDFGDKLKKTLEECIPCQDRLDLLLTFNPSFDFLKVFEDDIKSKLGLLTQLDDLLGNLDTYGDICQLLGFLNFMCIPDLQRMASILMATLLDFSIRMDLLYSVIASLITPMFTPILSGMTNLLNQYMALVVAPLQCVIDELDNTINKIPELSRTSRDLETGEKTKESANTILKSGLQLIREQLTTGQAIVTNKTAFYTEQLKKVLGDMNGTSGAYHEHAMKKLQIIRTIGLIVAMIDLKRKGTDLCNQGANPNSTELSNFFNNFLNPNSFFKLTTDEDGNIRIEEPDDILYKLEEPNNSAKIVSYEPDDLLRKRVSVTFKCSINTTSDNIDKTNAWIKDLNRL